VTTARKFNPPRFLADARNYWSTIAKTGVFLAAIVGAFALPPPADLSHAGGIRPDAMAKYAMFLVLAFCWLGMLRWNGKVHAPGWAWLGLGCFVVALVVSFAYLEGLRSRTALYDGRRVVVGSEYREAAAAFVRAHPSHSAEELVFDAAGNVGDVWTSDSIAGNVRRILGLYMLLFVSASVSILAVLHSIWLRSPRPKPAIRGQKRRPPD
jgi:hypothetical protein